MPTSSKEFTNRPDKTSVLNVNFIILAICGIWSPERRSPWFRLYTGFTCFSLFCMSCSLPEALAALYHYWGDLKSFAMNVCILVMTLMANIKAILFLTKKKSVHRLVNTLDDLLRRQRQRTSHSEILKILDNAYGNAWRNSVIYTLYCALTVFLWDSLPFLEMYFSDSWSDFLFPNVVWYPFLVNNNNLLYGLIYTKLALSNCFSCVVLIGLDMFFVSVMIHTQALLKVIKIRYSELRLLQDSDTICDTDEDGTVRELQERNLTNSHERMYRDLCNCIENHEDIIKFVEQLEALLNKMLLPQFVAGIVVICSTLLQFTSNFEVTSSTKFIMYFFAIMFQMFIYCWHAHGIMEESNLISFAAYSCQWPEASPVFKKSLRIVMCRAQKSLVLTSGKFYSISRETFVTLINASYSFYAVLRQLNDH